MSFSDTQIRKLQRDVKASDVRTREVNGKELSYIEGWYAIAEANRIFGFDGWSRETVEHRCVVSRDNRGSFHALYVAKVRITVRTDGAEVVREGFGSGDAQAPSVGEAHDKAIKTAETDATKRAFATFGKPFGLSLYLGSRKQMQDKPDIQRRRTLQRLGTNGRYYPAPRHQQNLLDPRLAPDNGHAPASGHSLDGINTGPQPNSEPDDGPHERPAPAPTNDNADAASSTAQAIDVGGHIDASAPVSSPHPGGRVGSDLGDVGQSFLLIDRPRRRRDPQHLKHVANQPCLVCSRTPSDAHHLKFAQPKAMAKKVSDEFTVPLCRTHHRQLHHGGDEVTWWIDMDIDPLPIAQDLWTQSKDGTSRLHTSELRTYEPDISKPDISKPDDGK